MDRPLSTLRQTTVAVRRPQSKAAPCAAHERSEEQTAGLDPYGSLHALKLRFPTVTLKSKANRRSTPAEATLLEVSIFRNALFKNQLEDLAKLRPFPRNRASYESFMHVR